MSSTDAEQQNQGQGPISFRHTTQSSPALIHHHHCHPFHPSPHPISLHTQPNSGLSPGSEAYQRLVKEAAALAPLVEGYQELQRKQKDVSFGGGGRGRAGLVGCMLC